MIRKIDHIAIAVKDLNREIKKYRDVLGLEMVGTETVAEQKVRVAIFKVGEISIELLEPTAEDSPISSFIEKRGGGIHHIALAVDHLANQIDTLREQGVAMLDTEPRRGADGARIAFAHPKDFSGVLMEFTQREE